MDSLTLDACTYREFDDEEAWRQSRQQSIGASESRAILGVGYAGESAVTVWEEKIGPLGPVDEHLRKRLLFGKIMEPALRKLFNAETGLQTRSGVSCISNEVEYISATPDGFVIEDGETGCLELKNIDPHQAGEWKEEPPLGVQVQCQHQMYVTGVSFDYAFAYGGGDNTFVHRVDRHDEFIQKTLLPKLAAFWDCVQQRVMPECEDYASVCKVLKRLHPDDNGEVVLLDVDAAEDYYALQGLKDVVKRIDKDIDKYQSRVMAALGDATYGVCPDGKTVSWKTQEVNYKPREAFTSKHRVMRFRDTPPKEIAHEAKLLLEGRADGKL